MTWNLVIKEGAIKDMTEAVSWYEKQRPLLGDEFLKEVENGFLNIKSNPYLYQRQRKNLRHGYVSRFPYIIVYEVEKKDIVVYAVIHAQRHPKKRYSRKEK